MPRACELPVEELVDYAEGSLREARRIQVAEHLATGCERCQGYLTWLGQLLPLMRNDRSAEPPAPLLEQLRALYHAPSVERHTSWQPLAEEHRAIERREFTRLAAIILMALLIAVWLRVAWLYQLVPWSAIVSRIERGRLDVRGGVDAPWLTVQPAQIITQGATVRSAADTVATIRFPDTSLVRIESDGEWFIRRLEASRNGRLSRLAIRQKKGKASYISAPPRRGFDTHFQIEVDGVTIELVGVATVTRADTGTIRVEMLQGESSIKANGEQTEARGGQTALIESQKPVLLSGTPSAPANAP